MRQIALRLPDDLMLKIKREASVYGLSISAYIRVALYSANTVTIHQKKN